MILSLWKNTKKTAGAYSICRVHMFSVFYVPLNWSGDIFFADAESRMYFPYIFKTNNLDCVYQLINMAYGQPQVYDQS